LENGYSVVLALPPEYKPDYTPFLFNRTAHLKLQANDWMHFYLLRTQKPKLMAEVAFHIENDRAISPVKAPFGSFSFSERLAPQLLYSFIGECVDQLSKRGVNSISITEPPLYYRKSGELLQTILLNQGFRVRKAEVSSGIKVDAINFEDKIEAWERRKLKQAKAKGITCKSLPITQLATVYDFILQCRRQRGNALSMTLDELSRTIASFRESFFLFAAFQDKELAAASISIQVRPDILYNFYSAHLRKFDTLSPMVLLMNHMYKFCRAHQFELLDLGTSAINGQPNFSLLDFKLRLGAVPSMKLSFEKELS
jgi:hypothetical protein